MPLLWTRRSLAEDQKGEVWKLEEMLPKLLLAVKKILSDKPLFVILTSYATDSSPLSLGYALTETMKDFKGEVRCGELCVLEKSNRRLISLAIQQFGRL